MIDIILETIGLATVLSLLFIIIRVVWEAKIRPLHCEHVYEPTGALQSGDTQVVFLTCKHCGKEIIITLDTTKAKICQMPLDKV